LNIPDLAVEQLFNQQGHTDKRANAKAADEDERTPLDQASENGHVEVVELLDTEKNPNETANGHVDVVLFFIYL
jgi:ankyrin repeat protein